MKRVHRLAKLLLIVGGINWGLVGLFHVNVIEALSGGGLVEQIVYLAMGLAAIQQAVGRQPQRRAALPRVIG